jgi:AAA+ ATPase superfamily predicted ATPase
MAEWGFYGRRQERAQLAQVLSRGRWFFLQISGRRRIGKTRLVQELLQPQRQERCSTSRSPTPIQREW